MLILAVSAVLFLSLIGFSYWYFNNSSPKIESIAVMPFMHEDENQKIEYLTDGIVGTLINNLSKNSDLSIKSTNTVFRYKGKEMMPKKIGEELNVQAVLIGRITKDTNGNRVNLELIDTKNEAVLWGEIYSLNPDNLVVLQRNVAKKITDKLRPQLSESKKQKIETEYTTDPKAYEAYLKGRFFWNKRDDDNIQKAIESE